jgi:hypothetical protein
MMSSEECMAKARYALARAADATDPYQKADWNLLAKQWAAQATSVEAQKTLQRALRDLLGD